MDRQEERREKRGAGRSLWEKNKEAERAEPGADGAADGETETESRALEEQGWGKRKLRSFREKWALVGEGGWEIVPGRENHMCKDLR